MKNNGKTKSSYRSGETNRQTSNRRVFFLLFPHFILQPHHPSGQTWVRFPTAFCSVSHYKQWQIKRIELDRGKLSALKCLHVELKTSKGLTLLILLIDLFRVNIAHKKTCL